MEYRLATIDDIPEMCRLRNLQLIDEGEDDPKDINDAMADFFRRKLEEGSLVQYMLEDNGRIIATAAVLFLELTPSFGVPTGVRGYITDMYTDPEYRRRGIATAMLEKLRNLAVERGVNRLMLGASVWGMPVYEKFGFKLTEDWMSMELD